MPPLKRDHVVIGPYTLKGGKLIFGTAAPLLDSDARQVMGAGRNFIVNFTAPDGLKEVTPASAECRSGRECEAGTMGNSHPADDVAWMMDRAPAYHHRRMKVRFRRVSSTGQRNTSRSLSAGVSKPKVFRGR